MRVSDLHSVGDDRISRFEIAAFGFLAWCSSELFVFLYHINVFFFGLVTTKQKQKKKKNNNMSAPDYRAWYRKSIELKSGKDLTPAQIDTFVDDTFQARKADIERHFAGVTTAEQVADKVKLYAEGSQFIDNDVKKFKSDTRDASLVGDERNLSEVSWENKPRPVDKPQVLRSRFVQAGPDALSETWEQSLLDVTGADLFTWRDSNIANGTNNSVYLYGLERERLNQVGPGEPRPPHNLEQLVGTGIIPAQWHDQQPIDAIMKRKAHKMAEEVYVKNIGPMASFGLMDQNLAPNQSGFMTDTLSLLPPLQPDYTQGSNSVELERVGLRPIEDTWLNPLEPARDTTYPVYTQAEEMKKTTEGIGFDWLY